MRAPAHPQRPIVFVSSPYKGLELYRRAVAEAIGRLSGWAWTGIEKSGAADCPSLQWCLDEVTKSTVFVGVLGPMYGSCPRGRRLSFSELEYNKARAAGIPRLMFLSREETTEPEQSRFRAKVSRDRLRATFGSPEGLAADVVIALYNWEIGGMQHSQGQIAARTDGKLVGSAPSRNAAAVKARLALKRRMQRDFLSEHYDPNEARNRPYSKFEYSRLIIHSIDNDSYPEPDPDGHTGISTWFRVEPYDFYHSGLEVSLEIVQGLFDDQGNWDISEYGEPPRRGTYKSRNLYVIGRIPYSSIVDYDPEGDEYYGVPHVYCRFEHDGTPYEEIVYSTVSTRKESPYDYDQRLDNARRLRLP